MVELIESCEKVKESLSQRIPIELLVIDTVTNPLSLVMNKGQWEGINAWDNFDKVTH